VAQPPALLLLLLRALLGQLEVRAKQLVQRHCGASIVGCEGVVVDPARGKRREGERKVEREV
jgi:hypothetical protein